MPKISRKKLIRLIFTAIFVLTVVFLDPKGDVLARFENGYARSYYFESCITNNSATSTVFDVVEVADGDTVIVSQGCIPTSVRMIGVDTPETIDPRKPVQCFGPKASAYTKKHLLGQQVSIEIDPSEGEKDKYGRALGYIILEDGTNFNKELIEEGFGREYTYGKKYTKWAEFRMAEAEAKEGGKGLWGGCN